VAVLAEHGEVVERHRAAFGDGYAVMHGERFCGPAAHTLAITL
jgi:hypothetical protein